MISSREKLSQQRETCLQNLFILLSKRGGGLGEVNLNIIKDVNQRIENGTPEGGT